MWLTVTVASSCAVTRFCSSSVPELVTTSVSVWVTVAWNVHTRLSWTGSVYGSDTTLPPNLQVAFVEPVSRLP